MTDLSRQYWKIKDFADHFGVHPTTVYKQIERGELRAIRVGKKALRIPSEEVERILASFAQPRDWPEDLPARVAEFERRTGHPPEEYVAAWRRGEIDDTPENSREAIEALALREALAEAAVAA